MLRFILFVVVVEVFVAQDVSAAEPLYSGPQAGERFTPLQVVLAYGERAGRQVDLLAEAAGRPTLLVMVHGANRPAARLTRALLNYAEMRTEEGLFAALVWLADDRFGAEAYLKQAISWWGVGTPVGIAIDGAEGPGSYGLNRKVNVTVLVGKNGRVTANFALIQPSELDASRILAEVVQLIGGAAPTAAESIFLSIPTRRPASATWIAASQDVRLRRLVCSLLAAEDSLSAERAAMRITQFVDRDPDRKQALTDIATALNRGRTRIRSLPAVKHLRLWARSAESARQGEQTKKAENR